jgi:hypothetical protein
MPWERRVPKSQQNAYYRIPTRVVILVAFAVALSACSVCRGAVPNDVAPLLGTLNGSDYLVSIDRTTGAGTQIGHLGIGFLEAMTALEYDARYRVLYGAVAQTLYTVDPLSGAAMPVGGGNLAFNAKGLANDPVADVLYGAGFDLDTFARNNLYYVDRETGTSSLIGPVAGISFGIQGLGFDWVSGTLYALDEILPSGARIVKINPSSLFATPVTGDINPSRTGWNGLTFDPVTNSLFVSDDREMYRVDPTTGDVTSLGPTVAPDPEVYGALTVMQPFVIPEPNSLIMAAFLLVSVLFVSGRELRSRK